MDEPGLLRSSAPITAWNLLSRLTGFVRVLAVGAALGATFLGNTYQSANLVSNLLFELLAAGVLSSVLVPTFVSRLTEGRREEARQLAGGVLGVLLAALVPVALAGMFGAHWIMRALTVTVADPQIRQAEIQLGAFLLWFFLPQLLLYAVGAVTTGLAQADHRFVAAAAAPVANNLAVIAAMAGYWASTNGDHGLALSVDEKLLLALGTTGGVALMALVPVVASARAGLGLRPRWTPRDPELRTMGRRGLWAGGHLALTQVLLGVTLVLANRVEGGAVAFQIAFTFFLLPYALVGNPLMTALFPRLAADAHQGDRARMAERLGEGMRLLVFLVMPASALLAACARPILDVVAFGALRGSEQLVAQAVAAYAVGLVGYSVFQVLTRAAYADGDTRSPTLVNLVAVGIGSVAMVVAWSAVGGAAKIAMLGLTHSAVQLAAALALGVVLARRLPGPLGVTRTLVRSGVGSALAGAAAWWVTRAINLHDRPGALVTVAAAAAAGAAVYAVTQVGAWPGRSRA